MCSFTDLSSVTGGVSRRPPYATGGDAGGPPGAGARGRSGEGGPGRHGTGPDLGPCPEALPRPIVRIVRVGGARPARRSFGLGGEGPKGSLLPPFARRGFAGQARLPPPVARGSRPAV